MPFTTMGARNTVPSSMARMVPLGLFHICLRLYSSTRWALGVMVAHLTATPYFLRGLGRVHGDLVIRLIPVLQAQVIVFGLQVHIGQNQLVLDHLPQDAGHLVAVHLHQRRFHQNLVQNNPVPFAIVFDRTEGPKLLYRVCTGLAIRGTAKEQRACAAAGFVLSSRYAAGAPVKAPRKESSHDP